MGDNTSMIIETHAINLPLAMAFNLSVSHLSANFEHSAPLEIRIPSLKADIFDKLPFSDQELQDGVDLKAMALAIQKYDDLGAQKWTSESLNAMSNPILIIILFVLEVLMFCILGYLARKVYLLYQVGKFIPVSSAKAIDTTARIIFVQEIPATTPPQMLNLSEYQAHLLVFGLSCLFLMWLLKFVKWLLKRCVVIPNRRAKETANPGLFLKIYSDSQNFLFKLTSIPAEESALTIVKCPTIESLATDQQKSVINIEWSGAVIYSVLGTSHTTHFPTVLAVPPAVIKEIACAVQHSLITSTLLKSPSAPVRVLNVTPSSGSHKNLGHSDLITTPSSNDKQAKASRLPATPSAPTESDEMQPRPSPAAEDSVQAVTYRHLLNALEDLTARTCISEKA